MQNIIIAVENVKMRKHVCSAQEKHDYESCSDNENMPICANCVYVNKKFNLNKKVNHKSNDN